MKIKLRSIFNYIKNRKTRFQINSKLGIYDNIEDDVYIHRMFKVFMGYSLDIKNPKTFNEKLQWLKLYNRRPEYTKMVDKYRVREYISEKIGEEYLIPLLGVWDDPDDIDFESLPNQFVLKCNHDSGGLSICRDKKTFDVNIAKKKLKKSLKTNYYYPGREWPYKNVSRKIIAEKYMVNDSNTDQFTDYKFFCFNGYVDCVMVCLDRNSGNPKFYFFDKEWNLKGYNKRGQEAPENFTIPKPICMDDMFEIASQLSKGIPFVRVDLYQSYNQIYFGEMTFYPDSGFDNNILPESDLYFGKLIDLELASNN